MAKIELDGNKLIIIDGKTRTDTGLTIDTSKLTTEPGNPEFFTLKRAYMMALGAGLTLTPKKPEGWVNLHAGKNRALEPEKKEAPAPAPKEKKPEEADKARAEREERQRKKREREEAKRQELKEEAERRIAKALEKKDARRAEEVKLEARHARPKPEITMGWIERMLKDAQKDEQKDPPGLAATNIYLNSAEVDRCLAAEKQRGTGRVTGQRDATIAVFNALYQIPGFRIFTNIGSAALAQDFPEFKKLRQTLNKSRDRLTEYADGDTIRAADMAIRYYLLNVIAPSDKAFHDELMQTTMAWRLENVKGNDAIKADPQYATAPDRVRAAFMRLYLAGAMDAETLVAAALYIRRDHISKVLEDLENSLRKRGKKEERIKAELEERRKEEPPLSVWKAPQVAAEAKAPEPATPAAAKRPTELDKFAEANWKDLAARISGAVVSGKLNDLITIMRNLPAGYKELGSPLKELARGDINDAFDKMYNEYLRTNDAFRAFVRKNPSYVDIHESATLSAESKPHKRRHVAEAVQDFIMAMAAKKDDPLFALFKEDLKLLTTKVLGLKSDGLVRDGMADMKTMAAVALFAWRNANPTAPVGAWAKELGIKVTLPVKGQPVEVTPPKRPEERMMNF